jgi:hypothetical protein
MFSELTNLLEKKEKFYIEKSELTKHQIASLIKPNSHKT